MSDAASPNHRLGGGLLITAGVLILLLSGLCTAALGLPFAFSEYGGRGSMLLVIVVADIPAIVAGVGLIMLGRRLGWPKPGADGRHRGMRRTMAIGLQIVGVLTAAAGIAGLFGNPVIGLVLLAIGCGMVWAGVALWRDQVDEPPTNIF